MDLRADLARSATVAIGLFLAVGAIPVGLGLALRPNGSAVGLPPSLLDGTPLPDYRIPGLVLCGVVGGSTLAAVVLAWRRAPRAPAASALAGAVVLGWITVQVVLIGYWSLLQPAVGACGLALLLLGRRAR